MREIHVDTIIDAVAKACINANCMIGEDIECAFQKAKKEEESALSLGVWDKLLENARIAREEKLPICQDTGTAVVFAELGQEAQISGGSLEEAINERVAKGYAEGYLRKSMVDDPVRRVNTGDNTPAVIHYSVVCGDSLRLTVAPKGGGSENMSALAMLKPAQGIEGVKDFVIETVKTAGPNPCPPIIVGVGVGGTMEKAALLAKQSLLREVGSVHEDAFWRDVEKELLERVNALGIGPAGLGGKTTALAVHVGVFSAHIASLPVAVNIGCHVTRHISVSL